MSDNPHYLDEPRDERGRWTSGGGSPASANIITTTSPDRQAGNRQSILSQFAPDSAAWTGPVPIPPGAPPISTHRRACRRRASLYRRAPISRVAWNPCPVSWATTCKHLCGTTGLGGLRGSSPANQPAFRPQSPNSIPIRTLAVLTRFAAHAAIVLIALCVQPAIAQLPGQAGFALPNPISFDDLITIGRRIHEEDCQALACRGYGIAISAYVMEPRYWSPHHPSGPGLPGRGEEAPPTFRASRCRDEGGL